MAILKDLTVLGPSRLIGNISSGDIEANGIVEIHNDASIDGVLTANTISDINKLNFDNLSGSIFKHYDAVSTNPFINIYGTQSYWPMYIGRHLSGVQHNYYGYQGFGFQYEWKSSSDYNLNIYAAVSNNNNIRKAITIDAFGGVGIQGPINGGNRSCAFMVNGVAGIKTRLEIGGDLEIDGYVKNNFPQIKINNPSTQAGQGATGIRIFRNNQTDPTNNAPPSPYKWDIGFLDKTINNSAYTVLGFQYGNNEIGLGIQYDTTANEYVLANTGVQGVKLLSQSNNAINTDQLFLMGTKTDYDGAAYRWGTNGPYMIGYEVFSGSDISLKKDIKGYDKEIVDKVFDKDNITYNFNWKDTNKNSDGFIAQYIEDIAPEVLSINDDGTKSVNYNAALSKMVGVMFLKIKELEKEIKDLKNQINKEES